MVCTRHARSIMKKYFIGIDEVGRGPLAGPVVIGLVCATQKVINKYSNIKESKQLSEKKREEWNEKILTDNSDDLITCVAYVDAKRIDKINISNAIKEAIQNACDSLEVDCNLCHVKLDGGLRAPERFLSQETIIKGDAKETVIAMASVIAKVSRDDYMSSLKDGKYNFKKHKGYGTKEHVKAIKEHGLSKEHRKSFCKNFI